MFGNIWNRARTKKREDEAAIRDTLANSPDQGLPWEDLGCRQGRFTIGQAQTWDTITAGSQVAERVRRSRTFGVS
jgi:hypothetical protein